MGFLFEMAGTIAGHAADQDVRTRKTAQLYENMQVANEAAADAIARGGRESALARIAGTKLIARQAAAYSASGVVSGVGTAVLTQAGTRQLTELDARTLRNNAAREAWGLKKQAKDMRKEVENLQAEQDAAGWQTGSTFLAQGMKGLTSMGMG